MGLNHTYKLLHSKGNNIQNEKTTMDWEQLFANDNTNKGLISKTHKQLMQLNIKTKHKPPHQKMDRRPK